MLHIFLINLKYLELLIHKNQLIQNLISKSKEITDKIVPNTKLSKVKSKLKSKP